MPKLTHVGHIAVDSGLIHCGDPLFLQDCPYHDWEATAEMATRTKDSAFKLDPEFAGIVITGMEDGMDYPVYTMHDDNGKLTRVIIDFEISSDN